MGKCHEEISGCGAGNLRLGSGCYWPCDLSCECWRLWRLVRREMLLRSSDSCQRPGPKGAAVLLITSSARGYQDPPRNTDARIT
jgi:hypothetical protein